MHYVWVHNVICVDLISLHSLFQYSAWQESDSSQVNRERFKRSRKRWLFECEYGRRHVWWTLTEGAPYKWTYLLLRPTYFEVAPVLTFYWIWAQCIFTPGAGKSVHLVLCKHLAAMPRGPSLSNNAKMTAIIISQHWGVWRGPEQYMYGLLFCVYSIEL